MSSVLPQPPIPAPPVRRLPVGAERVAGGVHFRLWAPARQQVAVVLEDDSGPQEHTLSAENNGYFSGLIADLGPDARYRYRLDDDPAYPDPASRFQPEGPHGPSQVIDPGSFVWSDQGWAGVHPAGQVIYELHIGTFTREGTWNAAARELPALAELGVTVLEIMPVVEFPGRFGWGYDGVDLYAPTRLYGTPDEFRAFVNTAHWLGLGVILDVVYNHLGPDGNYLKQFADAYFSGRYTTDWGEALNFDGPDAGPVREFFTGNAAYWIDEFHLDGLRLDATQNIYDSTHPHILADLVQAARTAAGERKVLIVGENEPQQAQLVRPPETGGYGLDMLWNDDFHHSAMVALTGREEAYYTDYRGRASEFVAAVKWGFLYQGQHYKWQRQRRGTPTLDLPPQVFVHFLQNHDQVANSGAGQRCHQLAAPGQYRALTALLLLGPATPMLFQGQEFAASTPFLYFADHTPELATLVGRGRAEFLAQFPSLALPDIQSRLRDPGDPETFACCKLDHSERERDFHAAVYALHRDLLRLRREDPVFRQQRRRGVDGAVLSEEAFVLRFFADDGQDRLLVVNLGNDLHLDPAPEPLLAPPAGCCWATLWSSEDPRYGGQGTPPLDTDNNWQIPGRAAVALHPIAAEDDHDA